MKIPFVNLQRQYQSIQQEIDNTVAEVFSASQFIGGSFVKTFENQFANTLSAKHCIATGNGTDSLFLILKALGIGQGDEVITPAFSCIASAECISLTGATPVFVDVDNNYYTIDSTKIENKITTKTKAVIAVHLYGQAADVISLQQICERHNLFLVEDCAQAHLTMFDTTPVGTFGIASAFSFYPTKNLGAYGDAGCIVTNNATLAEKIRRLANHGALEKNDHEYPGSNSRLDALQAAILSVKLKHLSKWNERRSEIAQQYSKTLSAVPHIQIPQTLYKANHSFHIYAIVTRQRNELRAHLSSNGIDTLIHYPLGIPFTKAYFSNQHSEINFTNTILLQNQVLSLPIYPELENFEVKSICDTILEFYK
jgi:dTDP-4-amino-4,6-dideoxygalactose transaminase